MRSFALDDNVDVVTIVRIVMVSVTILIVNRLTNDKGYGGCDGDHGGVMMMMMMLIIE